MLVVLDGAPTVALVVVEVRGLAADPLRADAAPDPAPDAARRRLVLGACRVADEAVPVLAPELLEREAQAWA
jgi:hypothetical protein